MDQKKILEICNLTAVFGNGKKIITAVQDLTFSLNRGETLGIVGESGSGKSVTALSILNLLPEQGGKISSGRNSFTVIND